MDLNGLPTFAGVESVTPAFLFDLDGTLVDSVYQHVLVWREALERSYQDPADMHRHLDGIGVRLPS